MHETVVVVVLPNLSSDTLFTSVTSYPFWIKLFPHSSTRLISGDGLPGLICWGRRLIDAWYTTTRSGSEHPQTSVRHYRIWQIVLRSHRRTDTPENRNTGEQSECTIAVSAAPPCTQTVTEGRREKCGNHWFSTRGQQDGLLSDGKFRADTFRIIR